MEECVSSLMEGGNWRSTHPLFVLRIKVLVLYHYCELQALMCLHFIHILSRFCFIEMVFLGCLLVLAWGETTNRTMADGREWYSCRTIRCGSGSWQDCGAGLWNRRQAHGVLAV